MPFQAIFQKKGRDVVHQIHSLPQFFPFIQLLNLLLCFLAVLLFCFVLKHAFHLSSVGYTLLRGVDLHNFHRHQSIGLSSLESLSKGAKPQGLPWRCGLKQLKSTLTEVFKHVLELLKASCLLFEVQWPLGHFLLFKPSL